MKNSSPFRLQSRIRLLLVGSSLLFLLGNVLSCSSDVDIENDYGFLQGPLKAWCTANVIGKGEKDVELDYLPNVIRCENGNAPLEALKAQAVAARSYLYYKMNLSGKIADGTSDQVYGCDGAPKPIHYQAVEETKGEILQYKGVQVAAFYVAGSIPSAASCIAKPGDNDYSNTEKYVTYNWKKSGDDLTQTTLGWVNAGNLANRGCKSQNGAACLAKQGWGYKDILMFYYGADIEFLTAQGHCVGKDDCECTPDELDTVSCGDDGQCKVKTRQCNSECKWNDYGACEAAPDTCTVGTSEMRSCGLCGVQSRQCNDTCQWNDWGPCTSEGVCKPDDVDQMTCGKCGTQKRTCTSQCVWTGYSDCSDQGQCSPGATELKTCGDCMYQTRTCSDQCGWTKYSECTLLSDESILTACNTGKLGTCAAGHLVCVDERVTCAVIHDPSQEICDGLDNDCDGTIDNEAQELSAPAPDLAAELLEIDAPKALEQGSSANVTVTFENVGNVSWSAGDVRLESRGFNQKSTSILRDSSWLDETVVTALNSPVDPGQTATFQFVVSVTENMASRLNDVCAECDFQNGEFLIEERFVLVEKSTGQLRCPSPEAALKILLYDPALSDGVVEDKSSDNNDDATGVLGAEHQTPAISTAINSRKEKDDGGCSMEATSPGPANPSAPIILMLIAGLLLRLRNKQSIAQSE